MDAKTDNYWRILQNTLEMTRYADAKATAVLSVWGILITLAFSNTGAIYSSFTSAWLLTVMILPPGLMVIASVYYAFLSIHPRMIPQAQPSLLFFGSIAESFKTVDQYHDALREELQEANALKDDLAQQIYINSVLASRKFRDVMRSIRLFAFTIATLLVEILVYSLAVAHS